MSGVKYGNEIKKINRSDTFTLFCVYAIMAGRKGDV